MFTDLLVFVCCFCCFFRVFWLVFYSGFCFYKFLASVWLWVWLVFFFLFFLGFPGVFVKTFLESSPVDSGVSRNQAWL